MDQAEGIKILLADEINSGITDGSTGCRIRATIKQRQFCHRAARALNRQNLFAAIQRALEDPYMAALDNKEAGAGITFSKENLALVIVAGHGPFRHELEFSFSESVKYGHSTENLRNTPGRRH